MSKIKKPRQKPKPDRIFSGDYSDEMWNRINKARTIRDLQSALYLICCRLQEFEAAMSKKIGG